MLMAMITPSWNFLQNIFVNIFKIKKNTHIVQFPNEKSKDTNSNFIEMILNYTSDI